MPADTTRIDSSVHLGSDPLIKQGPGTLVLSAANLHAGGTIVEEGTLVVRNLNALGQGGVQVRAGATLVLDGGGGRFTVPSLTLDPAGRIDVGMSQLSIRSGFSRAALLAAINTAKGDDGKWTGTSGIGSSVVEAMVAEGTNRTLGWLGWVDNGDASFTVGFAAAGDSNLDGCVDVTDIGNILEQMQGDSTEPATWNAGDFNHDEAVDVVDFADLIAVGVPLLDTGSYLPAPPPAAPENLRAMSVSTASIMLSWSTTDAPAGYEIERSADGVRNWWPVAPSATQISGTSATISGLKPGERAFFRLRAFAERPSWWWDDRYRSADTAAVAATAMPSAPRNVNAWPVGATSAMVEWTPGLGLRTGTVVERQRVGSPEWVYVGTTPSWYARGLIDNGVEANQSYMYRVRAVSHTALSDLAISAKPLAMPPEEPPVIDPPSDRDGDGVSDLDEIGRGLNPDSADTDGDGVDDGDEDNGGSDPSDPGSVARNDPWKARVEFTSQYGGVGRTFGEEIKETKIITMPASISLPATLNVTWSVDDAVRVNGQMLGNGYAGAGSKTITISVRTLTLELFDTVGGNWGGWVELAVPAVDLDVDSDNDGIVQGSAAEDAKENIAAKDATPGLYLQVQDEDTDGDGIVNWADGFNAIGDGLETDDVSAGASFAPLWFRIPEQVYAPDATLQIFYSASSPSAAVMDPHFLSWDRPTDGALRIWKKDAFLPRNGKSVLQGGDFVEPTNLASRPYTLADLGLHPGDNQLFLEAIRESSITGEQEIKFELTTRLNGQADEARLSDAVRVTTARIEVIADNRDGTAPFPTFGLTATRMPNPNAGLSGLVPDITQAYTINVYDPRGPQRIHTVYVADKPLPLTQSGTARYTTRTPFLAVPEEDLPLIDADEPVEGLLDGPLHPSDVIGQATVVPVSGTMIHIRYNGETTLGLIKKAAAEAAIALLKEVVLDVDAGLGDFKPGNENKTNVGGDQDTPGEYKTTDPGAMGKEAEARLHDRFTRIKATHKDPATRQLASQFRKGIIVDAMGIVKEVANKKDDVQLDLVFVRKGYEPKVGLPLDKDSVIVVEVKSSLSGSLTKESLAAREALSARPVAVANFNWRYKQVADEVFEVVEHKRIKGLVVLLQKHGARIVKVAPIVYSAAAFAVTNLSSETYARSEEIIDKMLDLRLDLDRDDQSNLNEFAFLMRELIQTHFGDDLELPTLQQMKHLMLQDDIGTAVIDQWIEVSKDMEKSTFNR